MAARGDKGNKMERMRQTLAMSLEGSSASLLRLLQQLASADAQRRGAGQAVLTAKGCTWVLVKNRLTFSRFLAPGERISVETWPLQGRFSLYPRHFDIFDAAGEHVAHVESLWAVMDIESRRLLNAEERGIEMAGVENLPFRPARRIQLDEGGERFDFTPDREQIDENGHMNNAAYLDAAEAHLPESLRGRALRAIAIDYEHELLPERHATLRVLPGEDCCLFEATMDGKICFRLREDFFPV